MRKKVGILIVDDETDFLEILKEILEKEFTPVISAHSAAEAIEHLKVHNFKAMILDYHMPGVGGVDLLRQIRADGSQIPVIFITGDPSRDLALSAVRLGAADIIEKPFKATDVIDIVSRVIDIDKRKTNLSAPEDSLGEVEKKKKMLGLLQVVSDKKRAS